MAIQYDKIKLIIWDLDDTFWAGTLSEGLINPNAENIELIRTLTDRGIVNMVCSKNDAEPAETKLTELGVADLFVFNSINWLPKGQRIADRIKEMGLRPVNCLFIDDNIQNLEEAKFSAVGLMTALPSEIKGIKDYFESKPASDTAHKRLKQYKVLETKAKAAAGFSDNTEFLFSSNIRVDICYDCMPELDRLAELVLRTNQLNFTKRRDTKEEVEALINDPACSTGYVKVRDNFGDYGITGFFAIKDGKCIHFLFSCRTIGQGVEQYVYATLGWPELETVQPVIGSVDSGKAPGWINQSEKESHESHKVGNIKILFKGACDLGQMAMYLDSDNIVGEFTYIGKERHNHIEYHNHSVNYLRFPFLSADERQEILRLPFADEEMFDSQLYSPDIALVVVSTMMESNLGIYRRKKDGYEIALLESRFPLTDPVNWPRYINRELFDADNAFTENFLRQFSEEYEFIGVLTPEQILENAKILLGKVSPTTKVCFILGPELEYEKETKEAYIGRHLTYAAINRLFREYAKTDPRMLLLDTNDFVKVQSDFTNNINHWQRKVYYGMAGVINRYISEISGTQVHRKSRLFLAITDIKYRLVNVGFLNTKLWKAMRKIRNRIKNG